MGWICGLHRLQESLSSAKVSRTMHLLVGWHIPYGVPSYRPFSCIHNYETARYAISGVSSMILTAMGEQSNNGNA
eukprot:6177834-Pleurochrysis_carterae.AAC.2